jgi:integrase
VELTAYVERYRLTHDVEASTVGQLRNAAKLITRFAGGQLTVESLSEELVNRWLLVRREAGLSPDTVRGNRTSILMLWRSAAEEGFTREPGRICRIKRRDRVIRAFNADDLAALLSAADSMQGAYRRHRIPQRLYLRSFVLAAYDTGLRLSDLLVIRRRDIWWPDSKGTAILSLVQTKTKHSHRVHLREATMREVDACAKSGQSREYIWGGVTKRHFFVRMRRLCQAAGLIGSSKLIRRAGASYVAKELGESAASRFLGHRSPELARRNYLDQNIVACEAPMPPPLP